MTARGSNGPYRLRGRTVAIVGLLLVAALPARGQPRPPTRPAPRPAPAVSIRGVADVGLRTFTAARSFEAVLGRATAPVFGGGVDVLLPRRTFVSLHVSRLRQTGQRVFVSNGQTFPLGIEATIADTPVDLSAGYRFVRPRWRAVPFVGGGVGWHRYSETSQFAAGDEDVSRTFTGYHALGGVEARIVRWVSVSGQAQWTTVPDALGVSPTSVAREFGESDLGGATFRVRIVVGR